MCSSWTVVCSGLSEAGIQCLGPVFIKLIKHSETKKHFKMKSYSGNKRMFGLESHHRRACLCHMVLRLEKKIHFLLFTRVKMTKLWMFLLQPFPKIVNSFVFVCCLKLPNGNIKHRMWQKLKWNTKKSLPRGTNNFRLDAVFSTLLLWTFVAIKKIIVHVGTYVGRFVWLPGDAVDIAHV